MNNSLIDKSSFDNSWYNPGPFWKRTLWYFVNVIFFINPLFPFVKIKPVLLRMFGAKVGKRCLIKQCVNIKYPWLLEIGDYAGLGENVWIDNLAKVTIRDHVTISQGALLLTGNHNYKSPSFDLMLGEITLNTGSWIGAKCVVGPGVEIGEYAMTTVGSIIIKKCEPYGIYQGNPAVLVKQRIIKK